jgi:hypothetical protein
MSLSGEQAKSFPFHIQKKLLAKEEVVFDVRNIVQDVIMYVLEKAFPNGIRPNSRIDIKNFQKYFFQINGVEIPSGIDMASLLETIGIRHGEKIFPVTSSGKNSLANLLDHLISQGNRLFYYDEFYDTHADFLGQIHISSAELLKTVLISIFPSCHYSRLYFSVSKNDSIESEVLRCFNMATTLLYEQIKEKLPYVPLDKIKQVLTQNGDFIWVSSGIYTHIGKIEIDEFDLRTIERKIKAETAEHGYISLAAIDVTQSLGLNPTLSEAAIKKGLFQKYFADRYENRGNIITRKGTILSSVAVFEDYCRAHERLTLDELFEFEKEIYGNAYNRSLSVAYDTMVRVDKDTFVSDSQINFNVELTDNAISRFVKTDVIPLRAVTSFTLFPYIDGYPWNLFLLESYCRRFSKSFKFQCLSANSLNVGAIFRKSAGFTDYTSILAYAVAHSDVRLLEKEVGEFLFDSGYVARRRGVVSKVITQARMLRER